jgi:hypothetical protein
MVPTGPTIQNLIGPLALASELPQGLHCCLARRMYDTFQTSTVSEPSQNPQCFPTCPSQAHEVVVLHPSSPNDSVALDVGQENQFQSDAWLPQVSRNVSSSSGSSSASATSATSTSWGFLGSAFPAGLNRSASPSMWSAGASVGSSLPDGLPPATHPPPLAPFSNSDVPSVSRLIVLVFLKSMLIIYYSVAQLLHLI